KLADPSRVRMAGSPVAALAALLQRALSLYSLRRAWMRVERLGGIPALVGTVDERSRGGRRCREPRWSVRASRNLAGGGCLHLVRRAPSRARLAHGSVRRLCARLLPPRESGRRPRISADSRSDPGRLGKRE